MLGLMGKEEGEGDLLYNSSSSLAFAILGGLKGDGWEIHDTCALWLHCHFQ